MEKPKVLFVHQEITPYLKESHMGTIGRFLPQGIQEKGKEIRTFMPRYGCINERRNQLHEVIRLSGMNLIIDDTDHPLIIKVASIQSARMQIYFIDNEDFFQRKFTLKDKNDKCFDDNDERAIFFSRGVIETVKKLGWAPDIVHCSGWFSSFLPLYFKTTLKENPMFSDTKVVFSIFDDEFPGQLSNDIVKKIKTKEMTNEDLELYKEPTYANICKAAVNFSDGVIFGSETINPEIEKYVISSGKPLLKFESMDTYIDAHNDFYDEVLVSESILSE